MSCMNMFIYVCLISVHIVILYSQC